MKERKEAKVFIGNGFFFKYDPKHSKTLAYFDTFPFCFPFSIESDRFRGINMHYLPMALRARALGILYSFRNNSLMSDDTKLRLSWEVLNAFAVFKPCVKEYIFTHVKSKFVNIGSDSWATSIFLPVSQFQKKPKEAVWRDSRRMIREARRK
jgi:hypothetical protein